MIFQNYHRHSHYTNPKIADSCASNEDYAKRAVQFGHGIISSCEHGWQGNYRETFELAQKYNLRFIFSVESYWVKDRLEKDNMNCHIFIAARNENGRQSINDILSEANITGYYYQARIDLDLILSLPKDDVIITSACLAFWKYEDIEDIIVKFKNYFGRNFLLEVQYHLTDKQKDINKRAINLSNKYNIPIIMGCDSHFIEETQYKERDDYIKSKGIFYEDEKGWYLDYPDYETAFSRFVEQGILTNSQIKEAMENTNVFLEVEEYNNPCFNDEIKMPTLYPQLQQKERDKIFIDLIWNKWDEEKNKIDKSKWELYENEIKKEIDTVVETKHSDYFLLDYELVKLAKTKGGMITPSGRGSGVSFFINKLLGLTMIDRISADVKMYPERFMSKTRIIEAKSLADLDLNLGNPEVFAEAQKELLGEESSYPMIAYGTLKPKSAWKMFARAKEIDFDVANEVSKQLDKYEMAMKHAESELDREEIDILKYIDSKYQDIYEDSKIYQGIIESLSIHPCAYLIYSGNIRKEIGLIKVKNNLCCCMDGKWAEEKKFLKNDLLKVSVVELIYKVFDRIGEEIPDERQLLKLCNENKKVWDVYKNAWTMGINQVEQTSTKGRVAKYAPKNASEICAFVAAIRPGFKSVYRQFENRENFSYGIKSLDELIQTPQFPQSFILYQEMQMAVLHYAGIPMTECYEIIKNIAKKRAEKVFSYKEIFLNGFSNIMIDVENKTIGEANELSHKIWQILEDSARYSFNASHSYSVAIDSLYGAYLKTNYPLQFYEVFLKILAEKSEKDRMNLVKTEAENAFGIRFPPMRFGQDNRDIVADETNNAINMSLQSIKGFSQSISENLYSIKDNSEDLFIDLLILMEESFGVSKKIGELIQLQYFQKYGGNKKLYSLYEEFISGKNRYSKKLTDKSKEKRIIELRNLEKELKDENIPLKQQLDIENSLLGYIQCIYDVKKRYGYVLDINTDFSPRLEIYFLSSGKIQTLKINKKQYNAKKINIGDIIYCNVIEDKPHVKLKDGGNVKNRNDWLQDESIRVYWITDYSINDINL